MLDSNFDVIILGTGLTEAVVAAALSKWGFRVAHIDQNSYYGGDEASLTLDEFANWVDSPKSNPEKYLSASRSTTVPPFARQYSICLSPTIIPSIGPFIDALIQSGVSKYSGFRLLDHVAVYDGAGGLKNVPGSKEDVFKNQDIGLVQKRRLMRFLTFAVGDYEQSAQLQGKHDMPFTKFLETVFSLSEELISVITYALAYSSKPTDPTKLVLPRIQRYLRSVGRYGPSPFLVGHYGGVGEISQGFCRAAAVNGAVYILGRNVVSITATSTTPATAGDTENTEPHPEKPHRYSVVLEDIPEPLHAHVILGPTSHVPVQLPSDTRYIPVSPSFQAAYAPTAIARCVAILEHPIKLHPPPQAGGNKEDDYGDDDDADSNEDHPEEETSSTVKILDTAVLVFPPGSLVDGFSASSAVVLMTGEGALSTPKGKCILYINLPVADGIGIDPSETLRPYLDAVLKLGEEFQDPLFTTFYIEHAKDTPSSAGDPHPINRPSWLVPPPVPLGPIGDVADAAAHNAEVTFHEILQALRDEGKRYQKEDAQNGGIWPKFVATENEDEV
ncbi:FAD/NAD(P)-binding domain-containing protein [Macrolepiota fuliginosa MF-IS2]|uniref:FAD/NAD(P)-binding domain-containing protein n=1 Tax=Macrolepiota fuliginosa MF-IS2 TaxID=1400762 RepID=A0A9P5XIG6_9AGAR|nr:FAD/NAD(P)-binding domain-containing protein [Macrolepiota fuliginosa MF-IS2]